MKRNILLLALAAALLSTSCTADYHYAKQFIRKHKWHTSHATEQIYLYLPTSLYRTNSTPLPSDPSLGPEALDSIARHNNLLLSALDDSLFLSQFGGALVARLSCLGVPVVKVDEERLLPPPSRDCLILDITALEAEEFVEHAQSGFTTRQGMAYVYDHDLRHFSSNLWLQMNYDTNYYFLNQEVGEEARFRATVLRLGDGEATMRVSTTPLSANDAYATAYALGTLCGQLYIERILLDYVHAKRGKNVWYMYYNPESNDVDVLVPYRQGMEGSFEVFTP